MLRQLNQRRGAEDGFTLIELLIAIVVVGILTAVVIVGIGGLVDSGEDAACAASRDAAEAGSAVFFANSPTNAWPATLAAMTGTTPPTLRLPTGGTATDTTYTINNWTLTMTAGSPPTFACS